jgi:ABC-type antimicrobial peptide transport system permease subunit
LRLQDYIALGWDQLKRRKVVTLLCVMGIAIGSASIIVALAFGESIAYYAERQMGYYLKTDEITVFNPSSGSGQTNPSGGANANEDAITPQKLELIKSLPHVKTVAEYEPLGGFQFTVDGSKTGYLNVTATDLETLPDFGSEFQQGASTGQEHVIILNYAATVGLQDIQAARRSASAPQRMDNEQPIISYPLYRKQLRLTYTVPLGNGNVKVLEFPVRVIAIEKRPVGMSDNMLRYSEKIGYIPQALARRIKEEIAAANPGGNYGRGMAGNSTVKVKVDHVSHVADTEKLIQTLKLRTATNLNQQERLAKEFLIFRLIFGGAGAFILFVASISIVVAMTMSTYQRRRQIGIMKVLGANLKQIRNMFIIESSLLGLIGGLVGILLSHWVIWGINILIYQFSGNGQNSSAEVLFISLWILPIGLLFALMTGILSGIFPAVKASRTDALTAIKRE